MASLAFACAQQFEGLIALNVDSYIIKGWHGTLFSIGITLFAIIWNTVLVRKLPLLEGVIVILHVFGFFAFIVVLWVMGPRSDAKTVWTDFQDNGSLVFSWYDRAGDYIDRCGLSLSSIGGAERCCLCPSTLHGGHCDCELHYGILHDNHYHVDTRRH
jgi:hypothetical protein